MRLGRSIVSAQIVLILWWVFVHCLLLFPTFLPPCAWGWPVRTWHWLPTPWMVVACLLLRNILICSLFLGPLLSVLVFNHIESEWDIIKYGGLQKSHIFLNEMNSDLSESLAYLHFAMISWVERRVRMEASKLSTISATDLEEPPKAWRTVYHVYLLIKNNFFREPYSSKTLWWNPGHPLPKLGSEPALSWASKAAMT